MNLHLDYHPDYRCLLRDFDGNLRWLRSTEKLSEQGVQNRMTIFVMVPPKRADGPVYTPQYKQSEETRIQQTNNNKPSVHILPTVSNDSPNVSGFYVDPNNYERLEKVAKGGFGTVYRARCKSTNEIVAMKELDVDADDPQQRQLYEREVGILANVRHPALLPLHGCTPFSSKPVIMTPFMGRGSCGKYVDLESRSLCPDEWTPTRKHIILYGVATGMCHMHEQRLIHRDLKPDNVLLDDNLEPKITDFGLSKFVQPGATKFQTIKGGTGPYMAPEFQG